QWFDGETFHAIPLALPAGSSGWGIGEDHVLEDRSGRWWFATFAAVYQYPAVRDLQALRTSRPVNVLPERMNCGFNRLYEDSHGNVWIGSAFLDTCKNKILFWNRQTSSIDSLNLDQIALPDSHDHGPSSFREDHSGNMWIGLSGKAGLLRVRHKRIELF